jgi:hypothetical protein
MAGKSVANGRVEIPADFAQRGPWHLQRFFDRLTIAEGSDGLWRLWKEWPGSEKQRLALWHMFTASLNRALDNERQDLARKKYREDQVKRQAAEQRQLGTREPQPTETQQQETR